MEQTLLLRAYTLRAKLSAVKYRCSCEVVLHCIDSYVSKVGRDSFYRQLGVNSIYMAVLLMVKQYVFLTTTILKIW